MTLKPYQEAVVSIYDENDNIIGTGVIIAKKYILTCGHVVCDALFIEDDDISSTYNKNISVGLFSATPKTKQQAKVLHVVLEEETQDKKANDVALLLLEEEINNFIKNNLHVDEIILKSKSPSCGLGTTPILNEKKEIIKYGNGIAADIFSKKYTNIQIKDETCYNK